MKRPARRALASCVEPKSDPIRKPRPHWVCQAGLGLAMYRPLIRALRAFSGPYFAPLSLQKFAKVSAEQQRLSSQKCYGFKGFGGCANVLKSTLDAQPCDGDGSRQWQASGGRTVRCEKLTRSSGNAAANRSRGNHSASDARSVFRLRRRNVLTSLSRTITPAPSRDFLTPNTTYVPMEAELPLINSVTAPAELTKALALEAIYKKKNKHDKGRMGAGKSRLPDCGVPGCDNSVYVPSDPIHAHRAHDPRATINSNVVLPTGSPNDPPIISGAGGNISPGSSGNSGHTVPNTGGGDARSCSNPTPQSGVHIPNGLAQPGAVFSTQSMSCAKLTA
ncbi:hypothetical protein FB451DRAFT_1512463 [Mycena latifolia]|nr:hypothetical protein FB451DRAFT_1512463 [Mycena latifolia]